MFGTLLGRSMAGGLSPRLPKRRLHVERLESRTLLSVTATLSAGLLTITGDANRDYIRVLLDASNGELKVESYFQTIGEFSNVTQIMVYAGSGKGTVVIVDPDVTTSTVIIGGDGGDVLEGGGGFTDLIGGSGTNKLIAGPGTTDLDPGSGINHLEDVKPTDVAIVDPDDTITHALPAAAADPDPDEEFSTQLTPSEVQTLIERAAASNANDSAIIAVVDRDGNLLGVEVEPGVSPLVTGNMQTLVFAIDGAIAEARTGAFFANDAAPLTSRTIQDLSQSTITQREVESNPTLTVTEPNSTVAGPGTVGPIEIGGHFPAGINNTPSADLYDIQNTNRDTSVYQTANGPVTLPSRFNVPLSDIPASIIADDEELSPPNSYGYISGLEPDAQPRGLGTLPGGIPIDRIIQGQVEVVGGIGVFFPGTTGYADAENSVLSANYNPNLPDLSMEAEYMAFAAVGGDPGLGLPVGTIEGIAPLPNIAFPLTPSEERIDLAGITLDILGPGGLKGPQTLYNFGQTLGTRYSLNDINMPNTFMPVNTAGALFLGGTPVPDGWLVTPHNGVGITAAQVEQIVEDGIAQAEQTRSAIRLPLDTTSEMVFAVSDEDGNIVGLFRMPDATVFSIGVAVAKARNEAYFDNASQLQPGDELPGVAPGTAATSRSFRYLAQPFYPEGVDGAPPGPWSILNDGGTNPTTGLNVGPPLPASAFTSVQGYNAFHLNTNFLDPFNPLNQNGVVFFPGSSGLYVNGVLIGGLGVSGDGVDEDDVVTTGAAGNYAAPQSLRIDQVFVDGVRVPYSNFDRNPEGGIVNVGGD